MKSLEIFIKPTHKISPFCQHTMGPMKPLINSKHHSIQTTDLGASVGLLINGIDNDLKKNSLTSCPPQLIKNLDCLWKNIEKSVEKWEGLYENLQAFVIGGWKKEMANPISENSENLFYEILEGCYKRNIPYSAMGLKDISASMDNIYSSGSNAYVFNKEFEKMFDEKKLKDYSAEEIKNILAQRYDYLEFAPEHSLKAGDRMNFLK